MQTRPSKNELVQRYHHQLTMGLGRIQAHLDSPNLPKDKISFLLAKQKELQQQLKMLKTKYPNDTFLRTGIQGASPSVISSSNAKEDSKSDVTVDGMVTRIFQGLSGYRNITVDDQLKNVLTELANGFVEQVAYNACLLASTKPRHEGSHPTKVELSNVVHVLSHQWGIDLPPLGPEESTKERSVSLESSDLSRRNHIRSVKFRPPKRGSFQTAVENSKKRSKLK